MAGFAYTSKVVLIDVFTLTSSWQQVLTSDKAKGLRGFKAKTRFNPGQAPGAFDLAFLSDSSDIDTSAAVTNGKGFTSFMGSGTGDMAAPGTGIFARTRDSGTVVLEIVQYG